jgi:hypothetical protein
MLGAFAAHGECFFLCFLCFARAGGDQVFYSVAANFNDILSRVARVLNGVIGGLGGFVGDCRRQLGWVISNSMGLMRGVYRTAATV